MPTRTFAGNRRELQVAGLRLVLVHAPGETPDQIFIWLPDKKVLLPADNFYKSFPNLYAIRGTAYRDVMKWVASLDRMRALDAVYLVPSHSRPIVGAARIRDTLTDYRDAIQYVHDQTVRLMNAGHGPEEIVQMVTLPPHLARRPYLQEYYGTVAWSVRAIFDGYLGWFGGNATHLFPLTPPERAKRLARMAGGEGALMDAAHQAMETGDLQWALELSDLVLHLSPDAADARQVRVDALTGLARYQTAATARNYYLTQALEADGRLVIGGGKRLISSDLLNLIPLDSFFASMAVRLDPAKSADVDMVAGFLFPDTGEAYTVHVRRGVAEVQPRFPDDPAISLTVDSLIWKEIAAGVRNPSVALLKDVDKEGGLIPIVRFLSLFQAD
jgi:alkyl sulfatase BDS1-like metallo-beta-lactamase superfamily hydrolase